MKIVCTSPSFSKHPVLKEQMHLHFNDVILNSEGKRFSKEELISYIGDATAVVVGLEEITKDVLDACPQLKIIAKYGVGLNNIDVNGCQERGIKIGWTGGINKLSVAEMTLGYMLMLCRNLFVTSSQLKNGIWNKEGGFQLTGKTVGIIGVGYIGKELIRLLKPFSCRILVNDIIEQESFYKENNLIEVSKKKLFEQSDIITIHTPYNENTHAMINQEAFKIMKKSAYVINSARGGIIDELALKDALINGQIAGAAIDVYLQEPPTDETLLRLENLICTPHIGGNAIEAVEAMGMSAIKHLREFYRV